MEFPPGGLSPSGNRGAVYRCSPVGGDNRAANAEGQPLVPIQHEYQAEYERAQDELSEHLLRRHSLLTRLSQLTQGWLRVDLHSESVLWMEYAQAGKILNEIAAESADINDYMAKVNHWGALCAKDGVQWCTLPEAEAVPWRTLFSDRRQKAS